VAQRLPANLLQIEFPPRRYSWGKYHPMGATSALVAEGKAGKSTVTMQKQLAIAAGRQFLDFPVTPGIAIYLSAEDPLDDVHRRAQRILRDFTPDEARRAMDRYRVIDAVGAGLQLIRIENGVAKISGDVDRLIAACLAAAEGQPIVDIVIDTLSRVNGGEENSNSVMAQAEAAGSRLAQATGAAVCFLHHTGKAAAREGITDHLAGRGASSFGDNCRSVLRLLPATPEMCRGLEGIDRDALARGDILKLVHAAFNVDRRTDPVWLRRTGGLLERFEPTKKSAAEAAENTLTAFVRWAVINREPFTRYIVSRRARSSVWPDGRVTEREAGAFFDAQLEARLIIPAGEVKRRPAFAIDTARAEVLLAKAAAVATAFMAAGEGSP